jgi:large subunit ribosomal protein L17
MHRHQYKGRKLHRERDQREALVKGLADSLVKYESIETTLPKAKEVVPYVEKLITKAKKGDLHSRRQVISDLQTIESAHKLVDEIAPKLAGRTSGHLRVERTRLRRGDNAQLARISFVDDLKEAPVAKSAVKTAAAKTEKPAAEAKAKTPAKKAPVAKAKAAKKEEK